MTDKADVQEGRDGFAGLNQLTSRLAGLDERGLVLSLAAFAEDSLGDLLKAFLRKNSSTAQLLAGFNAPLGSFSARIKATHSLGLITDDQFADLENLRKIRNLFSHTWEPITFDDSKISAKILNLSYSSIDDRFPETLADKLRTSISSILVELRVSINQIEIHDKSLQLIGARLIAGISNPPGDRLAAVKLSLRELRANLAASQGARKEFYLMLRQRWADRLLLGASAQSEEFRSEFFELMTSLRSEIEADATKAQS